MLDGRLGHVVGHSTWRGDESMGRTDDDDCSPAPLANHLLCRGAHQIEGPPHGDVHGASEAGHVRFEEPLSIAVSCIADSDIQFPESVGHLLDHPFHMGLVCHVPCQCDRVRSAVLDGLYNLFSLLTVGSVVDAHLRP
jgi:hypothetical protein